MNVINSRSNIANIARIDESSYSLMSIEQESGNGQDSDISYSSEDYLQTSSPSQKSSLRHDIQRARRKLSEEEDPGPETESPNIVVSDNHLAKQNKKRILQKSTLGSQRSKG